MTAHVSIERLNDLVDGLLSAAEADEIEIHLQQCAACRHDYATLSETVRALQALPRDGRVPDDAWDAIAARIGPRPVDEAEPEVAVYRLPTAERTTVGRRFAFTAPQLAAAAALVAVLSAGLMWVAIDGRPARAVVAQRGDAVDGVPGGAASRAVWFTDGRYTEVVTELEQILQEGGSLLTPETLASIEESLATIDAAIADVETALGVDPNSDLLMRMLTTHQRTKLRVLQRAAAAVQSQT